MRIAEAASILEQSVILQQDIDPMVHPLRIRQVTPMPEQMTVLPQFTTPRRRMDLQRETQSICRWCSLSRRDHSEQSQWSEDRRQGMSPTVSERDRDLLEEAQMITDPVFTERGTGMPVMEVEMERLAKCSDPLDCIENDGNSLLTDLLDLLNMSRQFG